MGHNTATMVAKTKSKLKMALAADKGVDFGKQHLKKKQKLANKLNKEKSSKKGGEKPTEEDWEYVEEEKENEDAELSEEESGSDEEVEEPMKIDFAGIDESDSDSSAGENDQNNDDSDEEDDEDIPMSDLEDLEDEEKEDLIPHQRLTINNTVALTAALKRIALPISKLTFSEHQSVTTSAPVEIADVSDDLNRELAFYAQSLSAVQEARKQLKAEGVPFTRPTDYFAEMVKADEHMAKIKAKLQERDKERKQTLDNIKTLKRKRQGADTDATNEAEMFDVGVEEELGKTSRKDRQGPNKRAKKDEKYGHGGKKRFKKSGDAQSTGDLRGFSSKKMKGVVKQRPGKARRAGKR